MSNQTKTWAEKAREESNLSPEACASAIGRCRAVYDQREKEPGGLTIDQAARLYAIYGEKSRSILRDYFHSIFA